MGRNYYAEVISILNECVDFKDVVFEVAKKHPKAVVEACIQLSPDKQWEDECVNLWRNGGKIAAIKHCRGVTGLDLKGAKRAVEQLESRL